MAEASYNSRNYPSLGSDSFHDEYNYRKRKKNIPRLAIFHHVKIMQISE